MTNTYDLRERAVEARRLLNSFLLDLAVGTRGLDILICPIIVPSVSRKTVAGLMLMACFYLVVSLSKLTLFCRHDRTMLQADDRDACLALHHQIIARHCRLPRHSCRSYTG